MLSYNPGLSGATLVDAHGARLTCDIRSQPVLDYPTKRPTKQGNIVPYLIALPKQNISIIDPLAKHRT